ncbi:hypothetical protein HPB52_007176 [Rhipicephalus sanguineus]|uniref:Chitinase II/V-like catalytic domain-containing protein n=1 Tax=Rhipicephalus sanguineus TaxID=34632 RepID=A0A9D4Q532_RHISA|nr:hypothetical protein HPB52_007176 [Rhipicephalus sanguineus]
MEKLTPYKSPTERHTCVLAAARRLFIPTLCPFQAPAGGFFSWIPKIFAAPDDQAPDQHIEAPQQTKASSAAGLPVHAGAAVQTTTQSPSTIIYGSDEDTDSTTTSVAVEGRPWEARSLCCVIFGMLLMPICLFVLSYYLTPQDVGELPPFTSPTSYTGSTSSITMATLPSIFPTLATPSTADPWAGVSPQCFNSRAINDNISGLNLKAYKAFGRQSSQKIFCLYNNSRFLRGHLYDFVPENLPLDYCSYIVYWSLAVANASASSRAQQFDAKYGLWRLRQMLQRHKLAQKVGVLMALGGYPEDSVHFSRLGRDPPAMGRFVSSVIQAIYAHRLSGLTIHWVASQVTCRSADDERTMSTLVGKFREAYWLNGWTRPSKLITAILPADRQFLRSTAARIVHHLDFAFFETHLIRPRAATLRLCVDVGFAALSFLQDISHIAQSDEKICAGISMTPWVLDLRNGSKLADSASKYTAVPGTASLFEICTVTTLCLDTSELSCNVLRIPLTVSSLASTAVPSMASSSTSDMTSSTTPDMNNTVDVNSTIDANTTIDVNTTVEDTTMGTSSTVSVSATTGAKSYQPGAIVFHNEATLIDMLFHGRSANGNFCVLLYDLDMDNYDSRCPATGTERVSLTQLDAAINIPPLDSLRVAFPPC